MRRIRVNKSCFVFSFLNNMVFYFTTSIAGLLRSPMDYPQRNGPEEAQLLPEGLLLPNEAILESSRFVSLL